jgi:hypothetical protein
MLRRATGVLIGSSAATAFAMALIAAHATSAAAQIPYHVFDDQTQIASIDFRFTTTRTLRESVLRQQIVQSEPGRLARVQRRLSFLPGIADPRPHPFTPLELQRDVARLRRHYEQAGFLGTRISYDVTFRNAENHFLATIIPSPVRGFDRLKILTGGASRC